MKFIEYADREMMMMDLANRLASEINEAVLVNDHATFAVPGGSTPGPIFDVLSATQVHWDKVTVLPTDERWVDEGSEFSNARLIRQRLLVGKAAAAQFVPLYRAESSLEETAEALGVELAAQMPLSVVLLGMGGDMHTASLFPGEELAGLMRHGNSPICYPVKMPGLDPRIERISLSETALNGAMSKHLLITGADKRAAFERALELNDPVAAPISAVAQNLNVHWAE